MPDLPLCCLDTSFSLQLVKPQHQTEVLLQSVNQVLPLSLWLQLHEHFVREYQPERGRIYKITKELPKEGQENKIHYYLHIEILNSHGQLVRKVKSEAYYKPLHKYLASPEVDVYYDKQNKYFVVDGFRLKENENEPDIALESSNVYDDMLLPKRQYTLAEKIIWIGGSIIIAVQLILYFIWR